MKKKLIVPTLCAAMLLGLHAFGADHSIIVLQEPGGGMNNPGMSGTGGASGTAPSGTPAGSGTAVHSGTGADSGGGINSGTGVYSGTGINASGTQPGKL